MKNIVIGGVPEHFNLPWRRLESTPVGRAFEWREYPGGTGAMVAALRDGALDAAVMLTEGAVAARSGGADFEIVSAYTDSPLLWGIHVPAGSALQIEADIRGRRYAISRRGSGSHLMAFAHARECGWSASDLRFVEVGSLEGARAAFRESRADVFFWEKFMTKPLVESGEFRRVGEFAAEWPAFVVCVRRALMEARGPQILALIDAVLEQARAFAVSTDAPRLITERFGLSDTDAREWLRLTRWPAAVGIEPAMLARVSDVLTAAGVTAQRSSP
jgi:ABC-type nitrate/sulfonate/bicarbonate transport system substrate-binding protein